MNVSYVVIYLILCVVIALMGRGRLMGFIGFLILGLAVHPLVALGVLVLTMPFHWPNRPPKRYRPLQDGERRPFFPQKKKKVEPAAPAKDGPAVPAPTVPATAPPSPASPPPEIVPAPVAPPPSEPVPAPAPALPMVTG